MGYQASMRRQIDEPGKKAEVVGQRRKKAGLKLICSGCGQPVPASRIQEVSEREVRDLPCFEYSTTVVVENVSDEVPALRIPEKVLPVAEQSTIQQTIRGSRSQGISEVRRRDQLPGDSSMAESTLQPLIWWCLERLEAKRRKPPLRQMGVDEIVPRQEADKFLTVVCNLETAEPLWSGKTRKKETLDEFFRDELRPRERKRIEAACVDACGSTVSVEPRATGRRSARSYTTSSTSSSMPTMPSTKCGRRTSPLKTKSAGLIKGKKMGSSLSRWKNLISCAARRTQPAVPDSNRQCVPVPVFSKRAWRGSGTTATSRRDAQLLAEVGWTN